MTRRRPVDCAKHGRRYATFVCQHLLEGAGKGWVLLESGDDERPDAWCLACDAEWSAGGEQWTEAFEQRAGIRLVCSGCYDELRARHGLSE